MAEFNQAMDAVALRTADGANATLADLSTTRTAASREVRWTLKPSAGDDGVFANLDSPGYDGPLDLRAEGRVLGLDARPRAARFFIDTTAPDARLLPWDAERVHRGAVDVRGSADDLHFSNYRILRSTVS